MNVQKTLLSVLVLSMLFGVVAASTDSIKAGLCELYTLINTVLIVVIFLLIVAAAVVYAGGQLLGAETRARASVWATSMFIGALIGVLIYVILPMLINTMMGSNIDLSTDCMGWTGP